MSDYNLFNLGKIAKTHNLSESMIHEVVKYMAEYGETAENAVAALGLKQLSTVEEMDKVIDFVFSGNELLITDFLLDIEDRKTKFLDRLTKDAMSKSRGTLSPHLIRKKIEENLNQ